MELQLPSNVASLSQIGKSNNSHVYKELDRQGNSIGSALKIIVHKEKGNHRSECNHLHNEYRLLKDLDHPNIIKVSPQMNNSSILQKKEVCALEVELADMDLFDKMSKMYPVLMEPSQIRSFFVQICKAIEYIHNKDISHNDIKLENIFLMESKGEAKLADFGFAKDYAPSSEEQLQNWHNRCKTMLAPEILQFLKNKNSSPLQTFDEKKSDIFALGITIFQALMLRLPFDKCAVADDSLFRYMFEGRKSDFWRQKEIINILKFLQKQDDFREEQFIDLINKMLEIDPKKRLSIQQVLEHPWFSRKMSKKNKTGCISF